MCFLHTNPRRILGYFRYLDDILVIYNEKSAVIKDMLSEFSLSPKLKFSSEVEENGKISFLDITIMKSQYTLGTSIYRKPTITDCIIPYDSFQPPQYKVSGVRIIKYLSSNTSCFIVCEASCFGLYMTIIRPICWLHVGIPTMFTIHIG